MLQHFLPFTLKVFINLELGYICGIRWKYNLSYFRCKLPIIPALFVERIIIPTPFINISSSKYHRISERVYFGGTSTLLHSSKYQYLH